MPFGTRFGAGTRRLAAGALLLAAAAAAHAACDGKVCPLNEGLRALGARSVALVLPSAHASEKSVAQVDPPAAPTSQSKRSAIFMTAVSEDGQVYSPDHGPIVIPREARYGLLALFVAGVALLYTLLTWSDRSRLASSVSPVAPVPPDPPVQKSGPDLPAPADLPAPPMAVDRPPASPTQEASWAALVRLCGGDAVRAATVIAGETAADPSLSADSPETLARAIARVRK